MLDLDEIITNNVTTGPATEPVSLSTVKLQAKRDPDDNDDNETMLRCAIAARVKIEHRLNRQIINASYTYKRDTFPSGDTIWLPASPLVSVTSVQYVDTAGDTQTLSTDVYSTDTTSTPGRILLKTETSQSWPSLQGSKKLAVTIVYVAGYGTAATSVPDNIRHAICLLAAHWIITREDVTDVRLLSIPKGVEYLLSAQRAYRFH